MVDSLFPAGREPIVPILPLRNSVLFPASVVPVNVGRARSVRLVEEVSGESRPLVGVVAQRKPETEDPTFAQLHTMGTLARILKVIRLSSGNYSIVLQGVSRMNIVEPLERQPILRARVERIHEQPIMDVEVEALASHLREGARKLSRFLPNKARDTSSMLDNVREPGALADLVTSNLPISNEAKQSVLALLDVRERLRRVLELVNRQGEVYRVKKEISTMVREEMSRSQREYLLRQQIKQIRRELGEDPDDEDELEQLRERVSRAEMSAEAAKAARKQLGRMSTMNAASGEYHVSRAYVEWLTDLPWARTTPDRLDVAQARQVLDEDHHGLEKPKRRILEYLAVRKLKNDVRGPLLCFLGPPGVGKTSLARSIARATGRNFVRISLGGVQDEAEIRGHRRTYVGSFPGRIVSALKKAGSKNPVILLDEIDKLAQDERGDPASALLEVLDPEQNAAFVDHYLEVPVDLSQVLFIATANRSDTIPRALKDRMEMIELPGYTAREKSAIARDFLVPRQLEDHGLTPERLEIGDKVITKLIEEYTREAGVRKLEQQVAGLCRAVAVRFANGEDLQVIASKAFVEATLGPPRGSRQDAATHPRVGVATSVVWTPGGGELLFVEATRMPGKGQIHLTGRMGDIMRESVATAFTYVRAHSGDLGLPDDFLDKLDVHVHLPAGAVPKDGAALGVPLFVALSSMLTRLLPRTDVASTGELTLRGNILAVTGIKEKCLAAHRAGVRHVILPRRNEADIDDVPNEVLRDLEIHYVAHASELLGLALITDAPRANPESAPAAPPHS